MLFFLVLVSYRFTVNQLLTLYCRLSWPLNHWLGRRWTIFLAALCSAGFCLGQAFANDWQTMFALRFLLGFGIGMKSATIPIYAAESAPADIRGALVMMWQLFTALGIMFGYLSGVAFSTIEGGIAALQAENPPQELLQNDSMNWRLMIGSPLVAPTILALYIFVQPESPRWLIYKAQEAKGRGEGRKNANNKHIQKAQTLYEQVFVSLVRLRGGSKIKAARDMLTIDLLLWRQTEKIDRDARTRSGGTNSLAREAWRSIIRLFSSRRNFSALRASTILMLLQQYCGINVEKPPKIPFS